VTAWRLTQGRDSRHGESLSEGKSPVATFGDPRAIYRAVLRGTDGPQQGRHHLAQGLPLRQTRADEQRQRPQALGLRHPTPEWCAAFKFQLEFAVKPVAKVRVVLSRTQ